MGQVIETLEHQASGAVELEQRVSVASSNQSSIQKMSPEEWEEVIAAVSKVWPAGLSAVDAVAEQRR